MNAIDRAERDAQAGDFGSAKRRLQSRLNTVGYAPELCERLARLSLRMGDPLEAGRWCFLCDSRDPQAPEAIHRFVADCRGDVQSLLYRLPAKTKLDSWDPYPEAVRDRLKRLGLPRAPAEPPPAPPRNSVDLAFEVGCAAVAAITLVLVPVCLVIGLIAVVRWLLQLLR